MRAKRGWSTEDVAETSEDDLKERLTGRMERQAILVRDDPPPPRVWALLDEQILHRDIAGPAAMADQMEHLAELARMPGVNVQVIPADRPHPGLMGAFVIADTGQPPATVFLETAWDGQVVEDPDMAESMTLMFDTLRMEALTGSASLAKIEEAARRWKEQAET